MKNMLRSLDSRELAEWIAYERYAGPLGSSYVERTLADLVDLLRHNNYIAGAQHKPNPVEMPSKPYPRPWQMTDQSEKD